MGFYENHILPRAIHLVCGTEAFRRIRARWVPGATGRVLEIGAGSGLNFPFYSPNRVERLVALEPSAALRRKAGPTAEQLAVPVEWVDCGAEDIPLEDASIDTVVVTYTLCSIEDDRRALAEMRRVLRPGGLLIFSEHGAAPEARVLRWQRRLTPLWRKVAGGCHLDRATTERVRASGFVLEEVESGYLSRGPRWASFNTAGRARRP